jgi:malate synthase
MPKPRFTVSVAPEFKTVLSPEALKFLGALQKQFNPQRLSLLAARQKRLKQIKAGKWHLPRPTSTTGAWKSPDRSTAR